MNPEFLKIATMECFKAWPAEVLKVYWFCVADANKCNDRIKFDARQNGIFCSSLSREQIANHFSWTVETVDSALANLGKVGLINKEVYAGCNIIKLGDVEGKKIIWNKIRGWTGAVRKIKEEDVKSDTVMKSVSQILSSRKEREQRQKQIRNKVVGDIFGERIVVVQKKRVPITTIPLDKFSIRYMERYGTYPTGVGTSSGARTYTKELRLHAKRFLEEMENNLDQACNLIDFAFDNLDKILENLSLAHPVEVHGIFLKSSCRKLKRWAKMGVPEKSQEKKKGNSYLDRFSGNDWDVPESLR